MTYLDNNATTPVDPAVVDAMLPFLRERFANPSASYRAGREAKAAIETARERVARVLNAAAEEIVFTSCGTESNNAVIESARMFWPERKRLVIATTEHAAVMEPALRWERDGGVVTRVPVGRDGVIDLAAFEKALAASDVALVSVMWANNETGVIAPMDGIVRIAHAAGAPVHTDAVQAVGKVRADVKETEIDYLSLSGHKFHAPKGVGALFVSRRARFHPSMLGGGQEGGRRSGTENVAGIVALGVAADLMMRQLDDGTEARIAAMRDEFEKRIIDALPDALVNGSREQRLGTTASLCFPGIDAAGLLILLDENGVCCSAGSACHAAAVHPSHVLEAMGLDAAHAASTLRFSFSRFNTPDEARTAADAVIAAARKLRDLKAADEGPVVLS